jgi:AraC-like DNA-binding protein
MRSRLDRIKDWEVEAQAAGYHACALAVKCGVSDRQLRRYFLRHFAVPPQEWLDRLRRSREMLETGVSVKEIAYELGYKHPSRFCEAFKREFGTTATAVMQQ